MNDENDKPPNQPEDDWAMTPNVDAPKAEKTDKWEMPEPVFRVSSGQSFVPSTRKDQPEIGQPAGAAPGHAETSAASMPDFQLEESRPPAAPAPSVHAPAAKKSSKVPLVLGGLLVMFLIAAAFLVGIYFLFLTKPEPVEVIKKSENISSNSSLSPSPSPAATKSEPPREIEYKTAMVLIPAGEFVMGSDTGEDLSKPAHKVTLPAFYIDKYEVTNAQYKEFCDQTQRLYPVNQYWNENYFLSRPNAPVVGISFEDAKAYAEWAKKRLPTEEEWEKAASWDDVTQTKREFPWGNEFAGENAAYNLTEPGDVGKYPAGASPYGALDMAGNASEWVDAFFKPYPNGTAENPEFGEKNRVVRGGYFGSKGDDRLKTTKRIYIPPDFVARGETASYIGFRCAISADDARLKNQSK